jgi:hypothetical protein
MRRAGGLWRTQLRAFTPGLRQTAGGAAGPHGSPDGGSGAGEGRGRATSLLCPVTRPEPLRSNGSEFCCAARLRTSEAYPSVVPRLQQFLVREPLPRAPLLKPLEQCTLTRPES